MPALARLVIAAFVVVPLLMIGSGVTLGVLLVTRPELFIDEPEPAEAASAFIEALGRRDLTAARELLVRSERELEGAVGYLGWSLADVLAEACPDAMRFTVHELERQADRARVEVQVHLQACMPGGERGPELDGALELRLVREQQDAFEGISLPILVSTPTWHVDIGFGRYLGALRARQAAPRADDDPIGISGLQIHEWTEQHVLVEAQVQNLGTRAIEEQVAEATCESDATGWRVELRPVDPSAGVITTLFGASLAEPLAAGQTRSLWTRLPAPPQGCEKLTLRHVGVRFVAPANPGTGPSLPGARARGALCGARVRAEGRLVLPSGDTVALGAPCVLGRDARAGIVLEDQAAELRHAHIGYRRGSYFIRPLAKAVLYVDENVVAGETQLAPGSVIRIGQTRLHFELPTLR